MRKSFFSGIKSVCCANFLRVLEPCLILAFMTTIHVYLPSFLGCTPVNCTYVRAEDNGGGKHPGAGAGPGAAGRNDTHRAGVGAGGVVVVNLTTFAAFPSGHAGSSTFDGPNECFPLAANDSRSELNLVAYTCPLEDTVVGGNSTSTLVHRTGSYSESATLFFGTGEQVRRKNKAEERGPECSFFILSGPKKVDTDLLSNGAIVNFTKSNQYIFYPLLSALTEI